MISVNRISAKNNPLIKLVCSLQSSSKARKENGLFVTEGLRICNDAEENGIKFDKLIVSEKFADKFPWDLKRLSENSGSVYIVTNEVFDKISDTQSPQGILAVSKIPSVNTAPDKNGKFIALENLQDPANLGAVARTAEALGIKGLIIESGCDPYSPKCIRNSMGTLLRMPLYFTESISDFIKENGLRGFACVVDHDAEKINNISFENGDVIIIGNEANGISEELKNVCERITIPMSGRAESLNAAAACAIAAWEAVKP